RADLREAAKAADPVADLCKAAEKFAARDAANGKAFADLAVTGKRAFAAFRRLRPTEAQVLACLRTRGDSRVRALPEAEQQRAVGQALDRAYAVANILRAGGFPTRCDAERRKLGWIAVSGEDDQPHRPVNVPSGEFTQYDLAVKVKGITVNTRYMI